MAVNIGPRIGIEGEAEYRKQIREITQAQKTLTAEMKKTEAEFDKNATAQQKNAAKGEILEKQIKQQEKQVQKLGYMTRQASEKFGENSEKTLKWKEALANAETELARLNAELEKTQTDRFAAALEASGQKLQSIGSKMTTVGDTLTTHVTAPIIAMGAASVAAYNEVDEAMDTIVKKTGASGDALEEMQDSAKSIAKRIPTSFQKAADAVGEVNTRFGVTGEELEDLSQYFVEFAELNEEDVTESVDSVQKAMEAFGVEAKDAKKVLDVMNGTGQRTGVSMSSLSASMVKNAASLQEMGMGIYQATSFLGDLEVSGADSEVVMNGLRTAMKNAAAEGKTLPEALAEFEGVMNSSASDTEKLNAAIDLFGTKAGPSIYKACQNGSLSFKGLSDDAQTYVGNVETTFTETLGPESKLVTTMNSLKETGSEIGETLLGILEPAVTSVGEYISKLGDWYNSLDTTTQQTIGKVTAATAIGGPILSGLGRVTTGLGNALEKAGPLVTKLGKLGASAGPIGLLAAAVAGLGIAWALTPIDRVAGYQEFMDKMDNIQKKVDGVKESSKQTNEKIKGIMDGVDLKTDSLNTLYQKIHGCFTANGSLKTGMEETAAYLVGEFNNQMGTDFSVDFTGNAQKNIDALNGMKSAMDEYITKLKEQAVQQAYSDTYQEAYTAQITAAESLEEAKIGVTEAQNNLNTAMKEYAEVNEAAANGVQYWGENNDPIALAIGDARDAVEDYRSEWETATSTLTNAARENETASTKVEMLDEAVSALANGDIEKGAKLMATAGEEAEEAGKAVEKHLTGQIEDATEALDEFINNSYFKDGIKVPKLKMPDILGAGKNIIKGLNNFLGKNSPTLSLRNSKILGATEKGNETKSIIERTVSNLQGRMGYINGTGSAASIAKGSMESVLTNLSAAVRKIDFINAVQSAWASMQNWFDNNPLTSWVREVTTSQSSGWNWSGLFGNAGYNANGNIINRPTLSWVGEAGPEAIIPLSNSRRSRAMDLYRQVGNILGVGAGTTNNNVTNMGGININVYAQPGQSVNDIAEAVSRKISAKVYSKGAVFA